MAHDVFISYSSHNKPTADAVCHSLEAQGIRCWIAPRDVQAGRFWKRSVVEAIRSARVMVLIFSGEVNASTQVQREVDIAFEARRPIVPFRIEAVEMNAELYYCLADRHWLDAITPPLEQHIDRLAQALRPLIASAVEPPALALPGAEDDDEPPPGASGESSARSDVDEAQSAHAEARQIPSFPALLEQRRRDAAGKPPAGPEPPPPIPEPATPTPDRGDAAARPQRGPLTPKRRALVAAALVGVGVVALGINLYFKSIATAQKNQGLEAFKAKKYAEALPLLTEAARAGDPEAQASLGRMYSNAWGVDRNYTEARKWFELAAAQDNATGISGLGFLYLTGNGGLPNDPTKALALLRKAADRDEPRAQTNLGYCYENGTGVKQDFAAARLWYQRAADQGSAIGERSLANLYYTGRGVPRSYLDAAKWYRAAAEQSDGLAACSLGDMYRDGVGVQKDYDQAVKWYHVAADGNDTCGQNNLGYMHWNGFGVPASYDESLRWYEMAAAQGDEHARSNIRKLQTGWVLSPLFPAAWRTVEDAERRKEIEQLRGENILEKVLAKEVRRMRRLDVNFYPASALFELEVGRPDGTFGILTYIRNKSRVILVDGKSTQIHELSASAPIQIETMPQAIAYLRFFMGAIQGEAGMFKLIDGVNDLHWLPSATAAQRKAQEEHIQRLSVAPSPSGGWSATATLEYSDALFIAHLLLEPNGMVTMTDDKPIATQLPVSIERFDEQGVRVTKAGKP